MLLFTRCLINVEFILINFNSYILLFTEGIINNIK